MAKVVVTKSKLDSLAQHINTKAGTTGAKTIAQMQATVDGISTKMSVTWHQCPEAVRNYLANVAYNASDYSNSQIADYAPATPVLTNEHPIGKTVDGVTYYNEIPNAETPFATTNAAGTLKPLDTLRQIWLPYVPNMQYNVRDLGGWSCDGGKVKYGMMFRGGILYSEFREVLVNECGVRAELDLRGRNEVSNPPPATSPLGTDILFYVPDTYQWYSISNKTVWREMLRFVFDCVLHNQPVYFHCAMGADRTGTMACVIEALLGMSQSDIDKDYELTCFATGTGSDGTARRRNESEWTGLINQINALPGSTFRDKVVGWVATLGFTAEEINAFRAAMIDGTPETVTPSIDTYTVTNTLTNATSDNAATSATEYQPYTAKITPARGYAISSVKVKMGGVDVTSSVWSGTETVLRRKVTASLTHCTSDNDKKTVIDGQGYAATLTAADNYTLEGASVTILMGGVDVSTFYKDGVIAIPNVTGDLVITALSKSNSRLPLEYQEVSWIGGDSNTGNYTFCIKPGLTWNDFDKIEFTGYRDQYDGYSGSNGIMLLATWTSAAARTAPYVTFTDSNGGFYCKGVTGSIDNNFTQAQLRESGFKTFTVTLTSHSNSGQVEFGSWSDASFGSHWQTKEQKWYSGTSLVRHLVPCYRTADGVIGMYDLVTAEFFTNAGGGHLIKGSDV